MRKQWIPTSAFNRYCRMATSTSSFHVGLLLFATVAITVSFAQANYSDCTTRLRILENALYDTGDNLFQLNRIFFPPSKRTSRFIRVSFIFEDSELDNSNELNALDNSNELNGINSNSTCFVSYIWAIGSFLFFQPPTVFLFTSLFFNYPNNNLTILPLLLPEECRPLITSDVNGECSCKIDSYLLDVLTQQVFAYSLAHRTSCSLLVCGFKIGFLPLIPSCACRISTVRPDFRM